RFLFKIPISDANCGLRVFTKDAYLRLHMASDGMEFASEMLVKAGLLKFKVVELPCSLLRGPSDRIPHLRPWRDGKRHLNFILLYAPDYLFKYPGIVFTFISLLGLSVLTPGVLHLGHRLIDYHVMLFFSLLLIVGYQMIWLSIFEKNLISHGELEIRVNLKNRSYQLAIDRWFLFAIFLVTLSLIISYFIFSAWWHTGNINLTQKRLLIWVVNLTAMGILTVANAFMVGIISLSRKR
ncbi:MAG: hypothetical protein WCG27_10835, partial [Pseudomonadota bacterium]